MRIFAPRSLSMCGSPRSTAGGRDYAQRWAMCSRRRMPAPCMLDCDKDRAPREPVTTPLWQWRLRCPKEISATADSGGSNGYRVRMWKLELGRFARETGLDIHVCHFPPGTSNGKRSSTACSRSSR